MKCLKANGAGIHVKRAQPLDMQEEEQHWEKGTLHKTSPQTLLDTMLFMCGIYFALRSSHHYLAHSIYCSHIKNTS